MDEQVIIKQKPPKSPVLAGLLALIPFGTGAFYNEQFLKGVIYMITFIGLLSSHLPAKGLLIAGFVIFQFFETIQSASAINAAAAGEKPSGAVKASGLPDIIPSGSIFWGSVLIVLGVLVILTNFEVIDQDTFFTIILPAAVIVLGLRLVIKSAAKPKKAE